MPAIRAGRWFSNDRVTLDPRKQGHRQAQCTNKRADSIQQSALGVMDIPRESILGSDLAPAAAYNQVYR